MITIITLNFVLQYRTLKLPLHPDSGLFLYKAVLSKAGEKFVGGKFKQAEYSGFRGDYARFRNKYFLFLLMDYFYKWIPPKAKNFRYFFMCYNSLNVIAIYVLGRMIFNEQIGIISAFLFILLSANPFADSYQLHIEHYAVLPLLLAMITLYPGNLHCLIITGLLLTFLLMLCKITFLPEVIVMLLFTVITLKAFAIGNMVIGAGIMFLSIYIISYLLGDLKTLIMSLGLKNPTKTLMHYKKIAHSKIAENGGLKKLNILELLQISSNSLPFFLSLAIIYIIFAFPFSEYVWLLVALFVASGAAIIIQGKYYQSHFFLLVPSVSLIAGKSIFLVYQNIKLDYLNSIFWIIAVVLGVFYIFWVVELLKYSLKSPLEYHLKKCALRNYESLGYLAGEIIARYVMENSKNRDRIVQWGYHHELYALANRRAAVGPKLETSLQTDPFLSDVSFGLVWRQWLLDSITEQKPKFIADMRGSLNINALNMATGLNYSVEKIFYTLFPLYKLKGLGSMLPKKIRLEELSLNPLENYVEEINSVVNSGNIKLADEKTKSSITKLFKDWEALNY